MNRAASGSSRSCWTSLLTSAAVCGVSFSVRLNQGQTGGCDGRQGSDADGCCHRAPCDVCWCATSDAPRRHMRCPPMNLPVNPRATTLDGTLADLLDLALLAKHATWNVYGPRFEALH